MYFSGFAYDHTLPALDCAFDTAIDYHVVLTPELAFDQGALADDRGLSCGFRHGGCLLTFGYDGSCRTRFLLRFSTKDSHECSFQFDRTA